MARNDIVKGNPSVAVKAESGAPDPERHIEEVREFLGFALGGESYALPLRNIREILKPPPITEVPRAPFDVPGIVSVRGRIVTVVDLRLRLRLAAADRGKMSRILLVEAGGETMGLLVDYVLQVFRLRAEEIEHSPAAGGDMAEYVMGIGRPRGGRGVGRARDITAPLHRDDDILILLDATSLLKR